MYLYPAAAHDTDTGDLLPGLRELAQTQEAGAAPQKFESGFDMKQSTTHDNARSTEDLFKHLRPTIVCDEGESADTFAPDVVAEHAAGNVLDMTVRMSNMFEEQFISKYMPRIFPWSLNYDCGGPEFPALFENWEDMISDQEELLKRGIRQRWRKLGEEAALVPGDYAKMLQTVA